jgi:hypothetical protein
MVPSCQSEEPDLNCPSMGIGVTVARLTLTQLVQVRILDPQFDQRPSHPRRASSLADGFDRSQTMPSWRCRLREDSSLPHKRLLTRGT